MGETTQKTVAVGGEQITIPTFSAFKAAHSMEILADVEEAVREILDRKGDYEREYATRHATEIPRAEARRQFSPRPLMRRVENEDGTVEVGPIVENGVALMGPDPLAHLTDQDWEASGNVLRVPELPDEQTVMLAMIPIAFKAARTAVFQLLALVLASNAECEQWDTEDSLDASLSAAAKTLMHKASAEELAALVVAAVEQAGDQIADPFKEAGMAIRSMLSPPQQEGSDQPAAAVVEPAEDPESGGTGSSPTSPTSSPADTAGPSESASTASAGVAS